MESNEPEKTEEVSSGSGDHRTEAHMDWMINMSVGDQIDCLKFDTKYKLRQWTTGEIEEINLHELSEGHKHFSHVVNTRGHSMVPKSF